MLKSVTNFIKKGVSAAPVRSSQTILSFKEPNEINKILTRSDQELGGYSTVDFTVENNIGRFHGNLNLDTPPNKPDIVYSGYSMFRTKDLPKTFLGFETFWDWDQFHHLIMRVKGDHRKYLVNIQADTPYVTDLYQHRLFLNTPGQWETVLIPIDDFVLTNLGVIQHQASMNRTRVKTFGIGLLDNQFGPYNLEIDYVRVAVGDDVAKELRKAKDEADRNELSIDTFRDARL